MTTVPTLEIADVAARTIAETCHSRHAPAGGFRIRVIHDAEGNDGLRIGFAPHPQSGDHVFAEGDAHVYVAPEAADRVHGLVLDARVIEGRATLYLRQPRS